MRNLALDKSACTWPTLKMWSSLFQRSCAPCALELLSFYHFVRTLYHLPGMVQTRAPPRPRPHFTQYMQGVCKNSVNFSFWQMRKDPYKGSLRQRFVHWNLFFFQGFVQQLPGAWRRPRLSAGDTIRWYKVGCVRVNSQNSAWTLSF